MDEGIVPQPLDLAIAGVRFGHRLGAQLDQDLAGLGLTWAQLRVLLALAEDGGLVHAGGIGRRMDISRQAAHRLLQRLDGRGFLAWRDDGWIRSARLTHEGYRALNDALASIDRTLGAFLGLDADERRALARILRHARVELHRASQPPETPWWME